MRLCIWDGWLERKNMEKTSVISIYTLYLFGVFFYMAEVCSLPFYYLFDGILVDYEDQGEGKWGGNGKTRLG